MKTEFDIAIIGLGAMGSASLFQGALKKKKVIGFDMFSPPHSYGSTHGGTRITRQTYFEGHEYIPILKHSYDLWRKIEKASGEDILNITGGLMIGDRFNSIVDKCLQSAKLYNLPYQLFNPVDLKNKFPVLNTGSNYFALLDESAGYLNPEKGVKSQLDLAKKLGAEIRFNEKVINWEINDNTGLVELFSETKKYFAQKLIITVGPWAVDQMKQYGIEIKPERIVQFWMKPKNDIKQFNPSNFPIFIWTVEKDLDLYGFPAVDNKMDGVKVAFYPHNKHPIRQYTHPDSIDREVSEEETLVMKEYLKRYIPELNTAPLKTITCMHVNSPDGHPIISKHPNYAQVLYGVGFSGHGFKFSNVVGEILTDLAISGKSKFNMKMFDISRFNKKAL
ncbi:N-methyl-L-tryptophan oxidase [Flexithrix dorotheae]|uniref:N-methyl-L-tryptophan oxidase n=1 Tax=Flexithrix dorotheae TaxID=70993 RepID=UPI0003A879F2|nr:N-methyl-L-tryptophan oxidase [Flexithrix dorotheae]